ncbi:HAD superfamily hydrolase (TIGR01509 family) [Keratinibaculum paraultunense]|uniref:HAD superfamily hydrolase (TIGR01509 family) n=1 Tax=Keratinibaculum paraultunense TaxID=1278232 RepID=A0A4R3L2Q2_9FIRM|nr:HAD family phosphatase [Keratinibaculum paraultunense]QQY80286.1 HAD family phosphatase [Keratinibaculum paraultunense]TCS90805.1 HAD superfamily hydrolase (TIGR01509 family) [Keratinibaculum paraultunense]
MKGAIFDLDGTLLDSMWLWDSLAYKYLLSIGINPPRDLDKQLEELTLREACVYMKEKFNIRYTPDKIKEDIESLLTDYYANKLQLKPYTLEILKEFKNRGIKMVIATSTDKHLVLMALNRHGIYDYFEFIQTVEDVGISKGNPKFFEITINKLGLNPEEIWVFEDALYPMISAKKCGLNIVAVKDESALKDLEKIKEVADIYIDNFSQLGVDKLWKSC